MNNVPLMQITDCIQNLPDSLGSVLFSEFSILANAIKEFSTSCEFCDDIVLVLDPSHVTVSYNAPRNTF